MVIFIVRVLIPATKPLVKENAVKPENEAKVLQLDMTPEIVVPFNDMCPQLSTAQLPVMLADVGSKPVRSKLRLIV